MLEAWKDGNLAIRGGVPNMGPFGRAINSYLLSTVAVKESGVLATEGRAPDWGRKSEL